MKMGLNINLTERQFKEKLQELFNHLSDEFSIFTVSHAGHYVLADIKIPSDIIDLKYSGTLVIANNNELPDFKQPDSVQVSADLVQIPNSSLNISSSTNTNTQTIAPLSIINQNLPVRTPRRSINTRTPTTSSTLRMPLSTPSTIPSTATTVSQQATSIVVVSDNADTDDELPSTNLYIPRLNSNTPTSTILPFTPIPITRTAYVSTLSISTATSAISVTTSLPTTALLPVNVSTDGATSQDPTTITATASLYNYNTFTPSLSYLNSTSRALNMKNMALVRARRQNYSSNPGVQLITVSRSNICNTAIAFYNSDSIIKDKLVITFEKESGEDLDGLTREFFSSFWGEFSKKYCEGNDQHNIIINPLCLFSPEKCQAIGRILIHGLLLTGYLPIHVNHATLFYIITGSRPSKDLMKKSFLQSLTSNERELLSKGIFDDATKVKLISVFSKFNILGVPNKENVEEMVEAASFHAAISSSYFYTDNMKKGASILAVEVKEMFDEEFFQYYTELLQPSGSSIIECLTPIFSDDDYLKAKEEMVLDYLKDNLQSMTKKKAAVFLKFVTGNEILLGKLFVEFNGEDNQNLMLPSANTCSQVVHLSRYINSQNQFNELLEQSLQTGDHWRFFRM